MELHSIFGIAAACWGVSEIVLGLATRAKSTAASIRDRGSLRLLWTVIAASLIAGFVLRTVNATRIHISGNLGFAISLALLVFGIGLRWTAILTLGRWFTSNVAIGCGHEIIRTGLYRYVRHPSYTGMLIAFTGMALAQRNWLSLGIVLIPITGAVLYRIRIEEAALIEAFGQEYLAYCGCTRRLLPGVY